MSPAEPAEGDGDAETPPASHSAASEPTVDAGRGRAASLLPLFVVGLLAGIVLWAVLPLGGATGTVGVVPIEGGINGKTAAEYSVAIERAVADPSIDAVVLRVSSPGGAATASESMYLRTLAATRDVPVVASVESMAASGSYYAIAPSDHIVAKPSSLVGSVGAVFIPPQEAQPTDAVIVTGPSKLAGASRRGWYYKTQSLQAAFLSAVMRHRGPNLTVSRETVATGKLFTGVEAVEAGLVDEIGSTRLAIERAASMAGLSEYDVRVIRPDGPTRFITRANYLASPAANKTMASPAYFVGGPSTRFSNTLFLPPELVRTGLLRQAGANETVRIRRPNGSRPTPTPTPEVTPGD